MRRPIRPLLAALVLAAGAAGAGQAAAASVPRDDFNLGQSARSGAVCQAVRDWEDPVGARAGRRAWVVKCRGWNQTLGHIYAFQRGGAAAQAEWRQAVAARAACDFASAKPVEGPARATLATCKSTGAGGAYVAYEARRGGALYVAEGSGGIADVLATGVAVAGGAMAAPAATQQASNLGAAIGGDVELLNAVADASAGSAENQKESAYREAQLWRFGEAESRFSQLASGTAANVAPADRAEALLNVAMNASNAGRFTQADADFASADAMIAEIGSPALRALALNNRAAHLRNQRKFAEAIAVGRQAIATRASADGPAGAALVVANDGAIRLSRAAASALNTQGKSASQQLGAYEREAVRDAQALQIIGTSQEALGQRAEARASLNQAAEILTRPRGADVLGSAAPWLTARIQADLARLDRSTGDAAAAVLRLQAAMAVYERQDPGNLPLGHFLIELARSKAAAGDENGALLDFERAFGIFQAKRGALGASADLAGAYFDILLQRIGDNPAAHHAEVERFFGSSEALVGESTAAASLQFAERLSLEGTASAGISRARDATLRLIDEKQQEIRLLQTANAYAGDTKTKAEADLDGLRLQANQLEQQLFEANPRYATALSTSVSLTDFQASLKPDEAYVKVLLLANRGYGLLITQGEVRPYAIEMNRAQAREMTAKLRQPFDNVVTGRLGRYDVVAARNMYKTLFGPIDARLSKVKTLIYQPDPTLVGLPIGALVTSDASLKTMVDNVQAARTAGSVLSYKGVDWMAARYDVSVSVSTAAFWNTRRSRPTQAAKPFLGFGDPLVSADRKPFASVAALAAATRGGGDYCETIRNQLLSLPALPETATEVTTVARALGAADSVVLGQAFTDEAVKKLGESANGLSQYRVLYFATHGLLPAANGCLQPSLVTSQGDAASDSLLDVREIPDLQLDADLVVLSACDTGAGDLGGGGAALGGLVSTFTYAGARNLLVSNWKVDSKATEMLMSMIFTSKEATQGDAIADAEKSFMARTDVYSHPYYWAAFSMVGDGQRAMPRSASIAD